jgi:tRNA G18 (ribose-2'-O)-methylase SpoU
MLGSEGAGLSSRWLAAADVRLRIDMARGVDSLNIAAAAAIAFFAVESAAGQGGA